MTLDEFRADDGLPKRFKMMRFIQENFRDELGPDMLLLDQPGGLERLEAKYTGLMLAREQREATAKAAGKVPQSSSTQVA
jgi:hypothetical protein